VINLRKTHLYIKLIIFLHISFEAFMAVNVQTVTPIVVLADANVSEEYPASTFMVQVCMLN
jgi:hypothetical protein